MTSMEQQFRTGNKLSSPPAGRLFARSLRALPRMVFLVCLVLLQLVFACAVDAQGITASEYELKAAMLYNLTRFVEWPTSAYPDAQAPTVLCILGRDPFAESLTALVAGKVVNGRLLAIRHLQNAKEIHGCHVVYISSSERKGIVQIFSTLKGSNALTVGEMTQFAARGGMIQFSLEEKQVRLEINLDVASQEGLKISSRLLLLARIVRKDSKDSARNGLSIEPQESQPSVYLLLPSTGERQRGSIEVATPRHLSDERLRRK